MFMSPNNYKEEDKSLDYVRSELDSGCNADL